MLIRLWVGCVVAFFGCGLRCVGGLFCFGFVVRSIVVCVCFCLLVVIDCCGDCGVWCFCLCYLMLFGLFDWWFDVVLVGCC